MHHLPTSCLDRLTPTDFVFIQRALLDDQSHSEALCTLFKDRKSLIALVEHDKLFEAINDNAYPLSISPELYFFVLVRRTLIQAGITELHIADYVAATLASHSTGTPMTGLQPTREDLDFTYHVDFIDEMEGLSNYDRFFLQVQCGNSFMVLTGLFPGFIENRANHRGATQVDYYQEAARCAFKWAAKHPLANEFDLENVYPVLADKFDDTRKALNHLANDYLFLGN
ncbi:MAG: hypothetical protein VXX36_14965 [Verrucomicrobiota bacterium]|nr:hypothetical protein [Verrucomicrobiota bacterium]